MHLLLNLILFLLLLLAIIKNTCLKITGRVTYHLLFSSANILFLLVLLVDSISLFFCLDLSTDNLLHFFSLGFGLLPLGFLLDLGPLIVMRCLSRTL